MFMERSAPGWRRAGAARPEMEEWENADVYNFQEIFIATSGQIMDSFHDEGYKWFHNTERPWDTATAVRADLERCVFSTAWHKYWMRIGFKRHSCVDHVYIVHMPTSWADNELWLEVWETLVSDFNEKTKSGEKISMVGDFNIHAKGIWDNTEDAKCMRIADFATRNGTDIKGGGSPTLPWRPFRRLLRQGERLLHRQGPWRRGDVHTGPDAGPPWPQGHLVRAPRPQGGTFVRVRRIPPQRRLQPPGQWSDIIKWKNILDSHVRDAQNCEGLQVGLEGARRGLEGYEDEGEDFEDEALKAQYARLGAKRAVWRSRAEAAPPGDRVRLNRAAWRASPGMAKIRQKQRWQGATRSGWGHGPRFYTSGPLANSGRNPKARSHCCKPTP